MTKLSPSSDRPELTESAWLRQLAAPPAPAGSTGAATTGSRPYYSELAAAADVREAAGRAGSHRAPDPVRDADAPAATGPIPRVSADQIDRLIHRLDREVRATASSSAASDVALEPADTAGTAAGQPTDGPTADAARTDSGAEPAEAVAGVQTVTPSRAVARSRARKPLLVLAAAALCALTVGGGTLAAMNKTVSVVVDGTPRQVTTLSDSVAGALSAAGITPGAHDAVAPDVHAAISDGSTVVVDRGRLLTLTVDGKQRQVWTTARTVDDALTQLGAGSQLSLSANRSRQIPLDGLAVTASTLHTVRLAVAGRPATSATSAAATVGQLLAGEKISLGAEDRVTPAASTPLSDGVTVTVDRVAVTSTTTTRALPQPAAETVADATLAKGTTKVVRQGHAGSQTISYQVTTVNGRQTAAREVSRTTVAAPVATVTHVGTKVVAPPVPKSTAPKSTFTYVGSEVFTNDTSFGVNWDGLAMCESTHNPKAINANPSAGLPTYGLFQFDLPTWASVGGSGNPIDASPQEQLMRAKLLYQSRNLEPWACRDAAH